MNDSMRVKILQSTNDLDRVALNFELMKALASLEQLIHALVLAEFEQDVYIFTVFEEMLEVAHILMLDTSVDLDLTHQLLFSPTFSQARLLNDF